MEKKVLIAIPLLLSVGFIFYYFSPPSNNMGFAKIYIDSEFMPKKYTCDGENINPRIEFNEPGIYAIIMHDPDAPAGDWFHWGIIFWGKEILEGLPKTHKGENFIQTYNDFYYYNYITGNIKGIGYDGPCPPKGKPHRYVFEVYKLDSKPDKDIIEKTDIIKFVKEHALEKQEFVYLYGR
ncbi:NEQ159 [Nanoarchaeum equitans Kin4-M]|uniref:NEQ159 n=1 Tax=Nanoarchaeum equitans (strain Kin4-M) TaxID=228908 RepID=Q74MM9_NANEQ|nr:NEQ159 [Nanoarchaeum equitans Kin4-M]